MVCWRMKDQSEKKWYVLRDLKRTNAQIRAYQMLQTLPDLHLEVFTPLVQRTVIRSGKKVLTEVPFINDLLFVYESQSILDPIIADIRTLQYRYVRGGKQNEPMTVRNEEMERFIALVQSRASIRYYKPEEITPSMYGRRIRIEGGALDGIEGLLMTIRGSKVKRLVVQLEGLLAAGVEVNPEYIQFI